MTLKKYEKIKMIYKGEVRKVECAFIENMYNIVPIYCSDDVQKIEVVRFHTNDIVVIANNEFIKSIEREMFEAYVVYCILTESKKNTHRVDIAIAYWFGFKRTIEMLKTGNLGDDIENRIVILEEELASKANSFMPSMKDILSGFSYVTIM